MKNNITKGLFVLGNALIKYFMENDSFKLGVKYKS